MKKVTLFFICYLIINGITAQNYKTLIFSDQKDTPIEDVKIYINRIDLIAVSGFSGKCEISDSIMQIRCIYSGYKDTTIILEKSKICTIKLDETPTLLTEVGIDSKYDPNAHLYKLFEMNSEKRNTIDTTVYYSFTIEYEIPELNQKEIMKGTIRHTYKKEAKYTVPFICDVEFYSNTIKDKDGADPYDNVLHALDNWKFFDYTIKSSKKAKKDIQILKNSDTIIFKVKFLNSESSSDNKNNYYYGFINNKNIYCMEESFECVNPTNTAYKMTQKLAKPIRYVYAVRRYFIYEYVNDNNLLYPKSFIRRYEYLNIKDEKKPIKMVMSVHVETIPNPNFETELDIRMNGNTTEYMETIKKQYPKLVIPNKE